MADDQDEVVRPTDEEDTFDFNYKKPKSKDRMPIIEGISEPAKYHVEKTGYQRHKEHR